MQIFTRKIADQKLNDEEKEIFLNKGKDFLKEEMPADLQKAMEEFLKKSSNIATNQNQDTFLIMAQHMATYLSPHFQTRKEFEKKVQDVEAAKANQRVAQVQMKLDEFIKLSGFCKPDEAKDCKEFFGLDFKGLKELEKEKIVEDDFGLTRRKVQLGSDTFEVTVVRRGSHKNSYSLVEYEEKWTKNGKEHRANAMAAFRKHRFSYLDNEVQLRWSTDGELQDVVELKSAEPISFESYNLKHQPKVDASQNVVSLREKVDSKADSMAEAMAQAKAETKEEMENFIPEGDEGIPAFMS